MAACMVLFRTVMVTIANVIICERKQNKQSLYKGLHVIHSKWNTSKSSLIQADIATTNPKAKPEYEYRACRERSFAPVVSGHFTVIFTIIAHITKNKRNISVGNTFEGSISTLRVRDYILYLNKQIFRCRFRQPYAAPCEPPSWKCSHFVSYVIDSLLPIYK